MVEVLVAMVEVDMVEVDMVDMILDMVEGTEEGAMEVEGMEVTMDGTPEETTYWNLLPRTHLLSVIGTVIQL